jgi:protein required for attachment to host cells
MKLKTGTWVIVADGGRGMLLVNLGTAARPELKARQVWDLNNPRTSVQGQDRPPRAFSPAGTHRAAHEPADIHAENEDRFIDGIVESLDEDAANSLFRQIAVFAPPGALSRFRKSDSDDLTRRVIAWIDKDLTRLPVPEITAAVVKALED